MRKIIVPILMTLVTTAAVALAQGSAPTAQLLTTLSDGGSDGLALSSDGSRLVVAAAAENQARLYDFSDPAKPQRIASVDVDGAPLAVGVVDFVLVAVASEDDGALLFVIAPDRYSPEGYGPVNFISIPENARIIAVSPSNRWALVAGDNGYLTMQLDAADNIQTSPIFQTGSSPVVAAALTDEVAYLASEGSPTLQWVSMDTSADLMNSMAAVRLDAPVTALAVNPDISIGAAALANNRVTLFDLDSRDTIGTIVLDDGPVNAMRFTTLGSTQYLVMTFADRPAALIYDVTDTTRVSPPGVINLRADVRALAVYRDTIALSDGRTVSVYQLAAG